ncbi:MAG: phosphatidate cytidylyltransferase [Muribaculaceae bacterium]|nr:phosphatidate cytidylyltransferase [Muribaculaceae bacterium]
MDKKKLLTRAISGIIYVGLIVGCILLGNVGISFLGVLLAILSTLELEHILHDNSRKSRLPLLAYDVVGVCFLALSFNPLLPLFPLIIWFILVLGRLIIQLYIKESDPVKELSHFFLTQLYLGIPLASMIAAGYLLNPKVVLIVFIMLWINDTGAYIVGSLIGKHRLFERISPKKSWEGFFGGLFFNIVTSILFFFFNPSFLGNHYNLVQWIGIAVIVTIFGTWGDLIESMIKRHLHIKDSGNLIPGHGGILDRIDSFLLAMPAAFIYLFLIIML